MVSCSLLLVLLGLSCLQSFTMADNANGASECCFAFQKNPFPEEKIVTYEDTRFDCPVNGVIFTTIKGFRMCADPGVAWVQKVIKSKTSASIQATNENIST